MENKIEITKRICKKIEDRLLTNESEDLYSEILETLVEYEEELDNLSKLSQVDE